MAVQEMRVRDKDFGIVYTENYGSATNSFISGACISGERGLLFCENHSTVSRLSFEQDTGKYKVENLDISLQDSIGAIAEYDGKVYILDRRRRNVTTFDTDGKEDTVIQLPTEEKVLAMSVTRYGIAITGIPSKVYYFHAERMDVIDIGFMKEPIHVEQRDENTFLVTDSLSHIVYEIDVTGKVIWSYGRKDEPGTDSGEMFMPMCAVYGKHDSIYIAEQRNHRIVQVSQSKELLREYGKCSQVGLTSGRLWAPDFAMYDQKTSIVYAVLSKSGTIVEINGGDYRTIYGRELIDYSELNFPRSCEWNDKLHLLLVADTGHDRVVVMSENGHIEKVIADIGGRPLGSPRCAVWIDDDILVTDSRNKRILLLNLELEVLQEYCLYESEFCQGHKWLQVALMNKKQCELLVATSDTINVYSTPNIELMWSSDDCGLYFCDLHSVCYDGTGTIVADTGHDRIVFMNQAGCTHVLEYVNTDSGRVKLNKPRLARRTNVGLIIVDSGSSRVYVIDNEFDANVLYSYGKRRGLSSNGLSAPRWATMGENEIIISDTDNHRIVIKDID